MDKILRLWTGIIWFLVRPCPALSSTRHRHNLRQAGGYAISL